MTVVADKYEHYRRRVREAMDARKMTNEELAHRMGAHPVTVSKLRNGKMRLDDQWRTRVAEAMRVTEGALFGEAALPAPPAHEIFAPLKRRGRKPNQQHRTMAVYSVSDTPRIATREAVAKGSLQCPPGLDQHDEAYALQPSDETMAPRYLVEDVLFVDPAQPARPGDHVVIQVLLYNDSGVETSVKRLDRLTDEEVTVFQYNPEVSSTYRRATVRTIHRVIPLKEVFTR